MNWYAEKLKLFHEAATSTPPDYDLMEHIIITSLLKLFPFDVRSDKSITCLKLESCRITFKRSTYKDTQSSIVLINIYNPTLEICITNEKQTNCDLLDSVIKNTIALISPDRIKELYS